MLPEFLQQLLIIMLACTDLTPQAWQCALQIQALETDLVAGLGQHITVEFQDITGKQ